MPLWARMLSHVERVVFRHSGAEPPFPGDTFLEQRRADAPPRQPTGYNLVRYWESVDKPIVTVEVVDAQGRIDPNAGHEVFFTVQGEGVIAASFPSPHDPWGRGFAGETGMWRGGLSAL